MNDFQAVVEALKQLGLAVAKAPEAPAAPVPAPSAPPPDRPHVVKGASADQTDRSFDAERMARIQKAFETQRASLGDLGGE